MCVRQEELGYTHVSARCWGCETRGMCRQRGVVEGMGRLCVGEAAALPQLLRTCKVRSNTDEELAAKEESEEEIQWGPEQWVRASKEGCKP